MWAARWWRPAVPKVVPLVHTWGGMGECILVAGKWRAK